MTWKEKFDKTKSWRRRAIIISLYYQMWIVRGKKKSIRTCAEYFGMSIGYISESIKIGNPDTYSSLSHCKTREEALNILRTHHE